MSDVRHLKPDRSEYALAMLGAALGMEKLRSRWAEHRGSLSMQELALIAGSLIRINRQVSRMLAAIGSEIGKRELRPISAGPVAVALPKKRRKHK